MWVRIGSGGHIAARGSVPRGAVYEVEPGDFHVIEVPGDAVALHWLELGGASDAQARSAARFELSDRLAADDAAEHVAVGTENGMSGQRIVAAVTEVQMRAWLQLLEERGIRADAMVPAPLLLPPPAEGYIAAGADGSLAVRGATDAFTADLALAEAIAAGAPIKRLTPAEAEIARLEASETPPLDLLQGEFAVREHAAGPGRARRLASIAAAATLTLLLALLVDGWRQDQAAEQAEAEIIAVAAAAGVPQTAADPVQALRLAAAERGAGGGFRAAASVLFAAVRGVPGASVERLEWRGGRLLADVLLQRGANVDALRPGVEGGGYTLVSSSSLPVEGGVRAAVELTP